MPARLSPDLACPWLSSPPFACQIRAYHALSGFGGDDTFYVYGGESVLSGKGEDKVVVTKLAVKYMKTKKRDAQSIYIDDTSSVQGDSVLIDGNLNPFARAGWSIYKVIC